MWLVVLAGGFSLLTAATVVLTARLLGPEDVLPPELMLPLLLIAGLIALVVSLAILVAAFHLFGLKDPSKPFGVPEGTLQVVVALSLILIFAITSLYLRGSFNVETVTVRGLTSDQVAQIPGTEILARVPNADDPTLFDVDRRVPVDEDAKDFSTQLLTILGTLVGAVAGFYFGAKSVETGVSAGGGTVPPTNTSAPRISGTPLVGESLRTDDGGWTGSPAPKYGYQWQRQTLGATDWSDIASATATSYLLASADAGQTLRVVVTATNSAGSQSASSAETPRVRQAPTPPATGIKLEVDPAAWVGALLRATHDDWAGTPTPTVTYQWQRKSPDAVEWSPISGAVMSSYTVGPDDAGYTIRVAVTGSNEVTAQTAFSAESGVILQVPVAPATGVQVVADRDIDVGAQLTATHGEWIGTPTPSVTYEWQRRLPAETAWSPIEGEVGATYTVLPGDAGYVIRVVVAGSNDAGTHEEPSNEVAIPT